MKPPVKDITRPVDLVLHSDIRAVERAEFDNQVRRAFPPGSFIILIDFLKEIELLTHHKYWFVGFDADAK